MAKPADTTRDASVPGKRVSMRCFAVILTAASLMSAGCTSLASRSRERDRERYDRPANDRRPDDGRWWDENATASRGRSRPVAELARTDREGIIAGELVDVREGRRLRGRTFIVVRPAEEATATGQRGNVGVETDDDGYFYMPGLVPGKTYILSVVREVDGRKIAGEAQVKPPSGNIRIELSEDRVSSITPPLPPPPGMGPFERGAAPPPGAVPATPNVEPPPTLRRESIAGTPSLPPTASIPAPPPLGPSRKIEDHVPEARRPPQRVPNFLVSDVMGSDWEFRYAHGSLILMEFWSTTCVPCQKAMPALKRLQGDYGASGLEIVAVACEANAEFNARARDVDEVARRKELNYRVYLEREGRVGEVQRLFDVKYLPTLVLLDRQGNVLWRGGAADADLLRLEEIVKTTLSRR